MKRILIFLLIIITFSSCLPDFKKEEIQYIKINLNNQYYDSVINNHEYVFNINLIKVNGANIGSFLFIQNYDTIDYTSSFLNTDNTQIKYKPELNNSKDTILFFEFITKPLNYDILDYQRTELIVKPDTLIKK